MKREREREIERERERRGEERRGKERRERKFLSFIFGDEQQIMFVQQNKLKINDHDVHLNILFVIQINCLCGSLQSPIQISVIQLQ